MRVKQAPEGAPSLDETVVERIKKVPGAWDAIVRIAHVSGVSAPEKRSIRYRREVAPFVDSLAERRDDLRARLEQGWDELGELSNEVPTDRRETMWMAWLAEYETVSFVLAVADEVRLGKAVVWEEARV